MRTFFLVTVVLSVLSMVSSSVAGAQEKLPCPGLDAATGAEEQALCWFDRDESEACEAGEQGDVSDCVRQAVSWCGDAAFDNAQVANACFLANIRAGLFDEAFSMSEYLREPPEDVAECVEALKLVSVNVVSNPPGAEISVAGRPYGAAPVRVRLGGKWWERSEVTVGFSSGGKTIEVKASGQDLKNAFVKDSCVMGDLLIVLEQGGPPGAEQGPALAGGGGVTMDDTGEGPGAAPWIVIGVSGAVAVGGAVLFGVALNDKSTVENAPRDTSLEELQDAHDRVPTFSTVGAVMFGVGLAGVTTGIVLLSLAGSSESEGPSVVLTPAGLGVWGSL